MKKPSLFIFLNIFALFLSAGNVEKTFFFDHFTIISTGTYQTISFPNTGLSGLTGEPLLPYREVILMLPPGESADSLSVFGEDETVIPGIFNLLPCQPAQPLSAPQTGEFFRKDQVYNLNGIYPASAAGHLLTQYLNGFTFALSTFTPLRYNPVNGTVSYFRKVTIRISTHPDPGSQAALQNLTASVSALQRVRYFAQNPEMMQQYPQQKSSGTDYEYLIITPAVFLNEFQALVNMHSDQGLTTQIVTVESISSSGTGWDLPEKIRNYIKGQYQNNGIEYVLLAGNTPLVPYRGFYCYVQSSQAYVDSNIPADLYFSGMDGNYDANGNHIYGEVADNADLLPEVSVARFTVADTAELRNLIHKIVSYQTNPVLEELKKPFLAAEYLYDDPVTFGGVYMDLLINDHSDNGYFTHGIPSATNTIEKLYDSLTPGGSVWSWSKSLLLAKINQGKTFIHHVGHANTNYMMRLSTSDITNVNFSLVNGIDHNYQLLYTQGCYCGAFDQSGCIAVKAVTIDNFLAGGVFNSRYGWFNQGTSDGPSEHLEREFVSVLYNDTTPDHHFGDAHMISKIKTAPWVTAPGEFEPGAQRWCHYCCNAFGDPAMEIWTEEPSVFSTVTWTGNQDTDWEKAGNWNPAVAPTSLKNVVIPNVTNKPVITKTIGTVCHDLLLQSGSNLTIPAGKKLTVWGTTVLQGGR